MMRWTQYAEYTVTFIAIATITAGLGLVGYMVIRELAR